MDAQFDARAAGRKLALGIRAYIASAVASLNERIDALSETVSKVVTLADVRAEVDRNAKRFAPIVKAEPLSAAVILNAAQPVLDAAIARCELELERRATLFFERAVEKIPVPANGKDGAPGKDGVPGSVVGGFSVQALDGGREIVFTLAVDGENLQSKTFTSMLIDRGIHSSGRTYSEGDVVTHSGSCWVAQQMTAEKPGQSPHWRLMVKKGRDGRDASSGVSE